ncbi:hypothetical protein HY091_03420 [Candidatus Kaiserbacteria bacterium]|nr:hypothetical protein [Candidatus Kaiserbacteria bacterium]
MGEYGKLKGKIARLERAERRAAADSATAVKKIGTLILHGQTTGDLIRDYVITRYGVIDKDTEGRYRGMNKILAGHAGELALLHWSTYEDMIRYLQNADGQCFPPPRHEHMHFVVGCLRSRNAEALEFSLDQDGLHCAIPFRAYASSTQNLNVMQGSLREDTMRELSHDITFSDWRRCALEVGDANVLKWLDVNYRDLAAKFRDGSFAERLGRLRLTSPTEATS